MPELPEVETIRLRLSRLIAGRRIASARVLRTGAIRPHTPARFRRALRGARIDGIARHGKLIVIRVARVDSSSADRCLLIHLRMTGHLHLESPSPQPPRFASVVCHLDDGNDLVFSDPRGLGRCELVSREEAAGRVAAIGVEPFSRGFTAERLCRLSSGSPIPIKAFLMDQSRIAGLGNIYSAEALFRARIHPLRPAGTLTAPEWKRLRTAIVEVLREAIGSARAGYRRPGRYSPGESFRMAVYGRRGEPCPRCRTPVARILLRQRGTYFCPRCQKAPAKTTRPKRPRGNAS